MAYCSSNPAGGKTLCATAASLYKTGGSESTKPGSSTSVVTNAIKDVWLWFCAKPNLSTEHQSMCVEHQKRDAILDKLRNPNLSTADRKAVYDEPKLHPNVAYATTQALYADFCKV